MIKIIPISYMIDGEDFNGNKIEDIETQVENILSENKNYSYVDLKYIQNNIVNVEEAKLIVEITKDDVTL